MIRQILVFSICTIICVTITGTSHGQEQSQKTDRSRREYPPQIEGAEVEVYKTVDDVALNAYIFKPKDHTADDRRAAIVFFFGGGWRAGSPTQFVPHCQHLAERGMLAVTVDYRVASRHSVKAVSCVADAKSAIRWLRSNASRLGVDPNKIAAGGGSAGGHLAACTAVIKQFDEPAEDLSISSTPDAAALFNPAVVLSEIEGKFSIPSERRKELDQRMGVPADQLSPFHQISGSVPPTIIFHGKEDKTVPYESVQWFAERMKESGNRCELIGYDGQGHGFFNANREDGKYFEQTIKQLDAFLTSLGYLQ